MMRRPRHKIPCPGIPTESLKDRRPPGRGAAGAGWQTGKEPPMTRNRHEGTAIVTGLVKPEIVGHAAAYSAAAGAAAGGVGGDGDGRGGDTDMPRSIFSLRPRGL
eukprot:746044-Hanusia_phi.AAC.1